ncbi:MAG: PDDEXK nuclease domain-containing protein [Geobacteraceae bacterium]|nr:PDDEXK nuclease domain-containing protein [Geobacteraceae bacterium]
MTTDLTHYAGLLGDIKTRIRQAQIKATLSANAEMILMYWDIGRMILERQKREGWGAAVIPRLSRDIRNDLPEVKGFSERNIGYMIRFSHEYGASPILHQPVAKLPGSSANSEKVPQPVAQMPPNDLSTNLQQLVAKIPWGHNIMLMEKVKELSARLWYMEQAIQNGWSRDTLAQMIKNSAHKRQGAAVTNFQQSLSSPQSDLARQLLKDPYIFDFLTIEEPFHERELETGLVGHLERFLLELGQGFAFVGRQYHLEVSDKDFYIDLLFYHLGLRCFVVVELKKGDFKPEYAGKMNFYCSAVDDKLKHETDQPTIGLILCQTKDRILAEYALRDINKPIGVSDYELTRALPERLQSALPTIEEIEAELQSEVGEGNAES